MDLSDALDFPQQNNQQAGGAVWPGQPANPTWPGQPPANPTWPGQPANPTWPAQPNQPAWPGQPGQPTAPGWPGPAPQTSPRALVRFVLDFCSFTNGIYNKMLITIAGEIKLNANNFTVNFKRGSDIAFHLNPRFNEGGRQVIVRNSMIGNQWGREERELPSFPFVPGKPFELKILCTDTEFKVAVNKSHLLEYKHRIRELNQIRDLSVYGDVTLSSVNVETLQ
uniref:Galectin n=1 Tax=Cyprinus carpio carpio TaxID=630221 RepID=A0A9J7XGA3_CYPCA